MTSGTARTSFAATSSIVMISASDVDSASSVRAVGLLPAAVLERSRRVECRGREARVGLEDAPLGRQEAAAPSVDRGQPAVVPLG